MFQMKSKSVRKRQRSRRRARNAKIQNQSEKNANVECSKGTASNSKSFIDPVTKAASLWRGIYESLVIRQCELKIDYWKQRAMKLEEENKELRNQLQTIVPDYETSSEEDDEEQRYLNGEHQYDDDEISPEYMEFRSVTLKHREELQKQRKIELLESKNDYDTPIVSPSPS
ncbi:uncharacterized protein LOC115066627 [Bactrocera dorsalis]|uniref:Uncharacterized protein LOC115066627 n=2 Tax=Endopterygota TaxID=33392 RepID=A0A034V3X3_BACDO|nr:uncharacterized protein LOC115066627 [Bactrocera dorsalis]